MVPDSGVEDGVGMTGKSPGDQDRNVEVSIGREVSSRPLSLVTCLVTIFFSVCLSSVLVSLCHPCFLRSKSPSSAKANKER
jgi:hypothetical protein